MNLLQAAQVEIQRKALEKADLQKEKEALEQILLKVECAVLERAAAAATIPPVQTVRSAPPTLVPNAPTNGDESEYGNPLGLDTSLEAPMEVVVPLKRPDCPIDDLCGADEAGLAKAQHLTKRFKDANARPAIAGRSSFAAVAESYAGTCVTDTN